MSALFFFTAAPDHREWRHCICIKDGAWGMSHCSQALADDQPLIATIMMASNALAVADSLLEDRARCGGQPGKGQPTGLHDLKVSGEKNS